MKKEVADNEFKAEMLEFKTEMSEFATEMRQFVVVATQKFDGLTADVRTNGIRLDKLEQRIEHLASDHGEKLDRIAARISELSAELKTLIGQFNKVGSVAILDTQRIDRLEVRVEALEAEVS
jgi:outer membrane murein-binding lipoprotein Lpp